MNHAKPNHPHFRFAQALLAIVLLAGCQSPSSNRLPLATSQPLTQLAASDIDSLPAGTIVVYRDLNSGNTLEEKIAEPNGRLLQSYVRSQRSFYYPPDPWADDENTNPSDMAALFPLQVGKSVVFQRHPAAGQTKDTVKVVRAETLILATGPVDTFVIETESHTLNGSWSGQSTFWYAPSLHYSVQKTIKDSDGDDRRRQLIEIKKP